MRRLLCFVGMHRWRCWAVNPQRAVLLGDLHPRAGCFDVCSACGKVWDDTAHWNVAEIISFPSATVAFQQMFGVRGGR